MMLPIKIRFNERDYLFEKMKTPPTYITDDKLINGVLDEIPNLCDITFRFHPTVHGLATSIWDNNSNTRITVDDLNSVAFDFYIKQVNAISYLQAKKEKAQEEERQLENRAEVCIKKIREILKANQVKVSV